MARTFPYQVYVGEHPETGAPVIGFTYGDMFIFDPTISECGRFAIDPKYYGLTTEEADLLAQANKAIDDATDKALNEACYDIQTALGVDDGGFAGMYFSDDAMWKHWVQQALAGYIAAQINFNGA